MRFDQIPQSQFSPYHLFVARLYEAVSPLYSRLYSLQHLSQTSGSRPSWQQQSDRNSEPAESQSCNLTPGYFMPELKLQSPNQAPIRTQANSGLQFKKFSGDTMFALRVATTAFLKLSNPRQFITKTQSSHWSLVFELSAAALGLPGWQQDILGMQPDAHGNLWLDVCVVDFVAVFWLRLVEWRHKKLMFQHSLSCLAAGCTWSADGGDIDAACAQHRTHETGTNYRQLPQSNHQRPLLAAVLSSYRPVFAVTGHQVAAQSALHAQKKQNTEWELSAKKVLKASHCFDLKKIRLLAVSEFIFNF